MQIKITVLETSANYLYHRDEEAKAQRHCKSLSKCVGNGAQWEFVFRSATLPLSKPASGWMTVSEPSESIYSVYIY